MGVRIEFFGRIYAQTPAIENPGQGPRTGASHWQFYMYFFLPVLTVLATVDCCSKLYILSVVVVGSLSFCSNVETCCHDCVKKQCRAWICRAHDTLDTKVPGYIWWGNILHLCHCACCIVFCIRYRYVSFFHDSRCWSYWLIR